MDTASLDQAQSNRYAPAAGSLHTVLVLAALGGWAYLAAFFAARSGTSAQPNHLRAYAASILLEWLAFTLVVVGVRRSGRSVFLVLGERWRSARQVLRDIGIAAGFWIAASALLALFSWLLRITGTNPRVLQMLPHGGIEIALWITLSVSAGICEETIFRGYLQRQFIAWTKNPLAGILLSALAFGAAHAYQGFRMTVLIALYGAMFGGLAYWRGSVRPGMIAHAWQDSFNGVLAGLPRH